MSFTSFTTDKFISLFVKNIWFFEEKDADKSTVLPFYADGYPGLIFQEAENGLMVSPHNKLMPLLFLYGQTINPVTLHMQGKHRLIVFQLFPFVLKTFFDITPKDLVDGCYDMKQLENNFAIIQELHQRKTLHPEKVTQLISKLLIEIYLSKRSKVDTAIMQAVEIILQLKGNITVRQICSKVHLTERTFERRFTTEIGIRPKLFARIIQFQQSLEQITLKEYDKLSDVVYRQGFSDQSHFIRVFKSFSGKTPKKIIPEIK